MVKFVDPVIYKYIAEEFCAAAKVLEQARELLHLNHECCHQALQSESFQRTIQDWQELDISVGRFDLRPSPGSVLDLHVAEEQWAEYSHDMLDIARMNARTVQMHKETNAQWCQCMHLLHEILCFGRIVEVSRVFEYRACCQKTQEVIQKTLSMKLGDHCEVPKDQLAIS
jgi:hypothetical protein